MRDEWFDRHTQQLRPEKLEDGDLMYRYFLLPMSLFGPAKDVCRFMSAKNADGTLLSEYDVKAETLLAMCFFPHRLHR